MMVNDRYRMYPLTGQDMVGRTQTAIHEHGCRAGLILHFVDQFQRWLEKFDHMAILGSDNATAADQPRGPAELFFDERQDSPARRNCVRIGIVMHHNQMVLIFRQNGEQTIRLRRAERFKLGHSPGVHQCQARQRATSNYEIHDNGERGLEKFPVAFSQNYSAQVVDTIWLKGESVNISTSRIKLAE
jgi:hypothetical protein